MTATQFRLGRPTLFRRDSFVRSVVEETLACPGVFFLHKRKAAIVLSRVSVRRNALVGGC